MKKISYLLLCFVLFAGVKISAQITITQSDLQSFTNIGNNLTISIDTSTSSIDIGSTGATSWDFSGISADQQFNVTSEDPSGTTFAGSFPAATVCLHGTTYVMGYSAESWSYAGVNNALLNYGMGAQTEISGFQATVIQHIDPAEQTVIVPITMNTNWMQDYVETDSITALGFTTVNTYDTHVENTVDAYGTITLPGGGMTEALRVRSDVTENTQTSDGSTYSRRISYLFITNTGTQISVDAADTTQPSSGVIDITGITYINAGITGVKQADNNVPQKFLLEQNYPNPFNPTTQINYSIPSAQKVTLKVYDELGKEVATLVNNEQAAGNYTVDFDASRFASGVYFYRIQAGNFMQMKKMILMK